MRLLTAEEAQNITSFKELVEVTGVKLVDFANRYGIVYRTVQQWKSDKAAGNCPEWALKMFIKDFTEPDPNIERLMALYNECPEKEALLQIMENFNSDEDFE